MSPIGPLATIWLSCPLHTLFQTPYKTENCLSHDMLQNHSHVFVSVLQQSFIK